MEQKLTLDEFVSFVNKHLASFEPLDQDGSSYLLKNNGFNLKISKIGSLYPNYFIMAAYENFILVKYSVQLPPENSSLIIKHFEKIGAVSSPVEKPKDFTMIENLFNKVHEINRYKILENKKKENAKLEEVIKNFREVIR